MTTTWNVDAARRQYAIAHWGENYFDVDDKGNLIARPRGPGGPALALPDIVEAARARGSRLPLLVRFSDILHDRLARLQGAFAKAMSDYGYGGGYYNYAVPYVPQPYVGYYGYYGFDPTANNWEYYRTSSPGRGWDAESTR